METHDPDWIVDEALYTGPIPPDRIVGAGPPFPIRATSLAESFEILDCPPPATVTAATRLAGAFAATSTVRAIAGSVLPAAATSVRLQMAAATSQVQPVPASVVKLRPW